MITPKATTVDQKQIIETCQQQAGYDIINEWRNQLQQILSSFELSSTSEIIEYLFFNYYVTPKNVDVDAQYNQILNSLLLQKGILPVKQLNQPSWPDSEKKDDPKNADDQTNQKED